jgi:Response regulator receiver domain
MTGYDSPSSAGVATVATQFALLDDETEELEKLSVELSSYAGTTVRQAADYKGFRELIKQYEFDAASIDWELHGVEKGKEILGFLRKDYPEIARVVYTKHERRKNDAMLYGADACIIKRLDEDLREYHETMEKAARLGLARRIVNRLSEFEETNLPTLPPGELLNDQDENRIYEYACRFAALRRLEGNEDLELRRHLLRRGWWHEVNFSASSFARLPWHEKIKLLTEYIGIVPGDLSHILGVRTEVVEALFTHGTSAAAGDLKLLDAVDRLLSVIGYVLRLSGYDPEVMPYLWSVRSLYESSSEKPPWNDLGFAAYLRAQGRRGIDESLIWIRGH